MNFKLSYLNGFFVDKNMNLNFLKTSIAKKIFKEISLITGLIDKKELKNRTLSTATLFLTH